MLLLKFITTKYEKMIQKDSNEKFFTLSRADKCFLFMYHALLLFIVFLFFHRLCHTALATTIIIISKYVSTAVIGVVMEKHKKKIFFHLEHEAKSCHQTRFSRLISHIYIQLSNVDDVLTTYSDVRSGSFSTRIVWITMSIWIAMNNSIRCASLWAFFLFILRCRLNTLLKFNSRRRRRRNVRSKFRKLR